MRLFRVIPVLSLLFGARASSLESREPASHPLDVRQLLDVCANIKTDLAVPDLLGVLKAVGVVDVCLCLSALPLFLQTNVVAILAVTVAGQDVTSRILADLITGAAPSAKCQYPDHSTPACIDGNPCAFTCTDGFTAFPQGNPSECRCKLPSIVCNGKCVARGSCPTAGAINKKKKRSWVGSGSCLDMGPEWAACGVFGGGARAWECVNTERDLESCGGCMVPLNAYSRLGTDCTALPGVADVACLSGECVVHRCLPGYIPALGGTRCIRKYKKMPYIEDDIASTPAGVYGLEHVPLGRN
ncbi:hypothetical protein BC826DRAFT_1106580 [Russula brevipes]|nr:hypothetical protein BC826DRAFT_1106580 [Russula brevipes]